MTNFLVRVLISIISLLPFATFASEADWQVAKATSQVTFTTDNRTWNAVKTGMALPNGAWISTGPRGRAVLHRNVESITFHPKTLASLTTSYSAIRKTSILQQQGTLDLEIEKRATPHTFVETPYLAAVVKGTIFSVSVTKGAAKVSVQRGLVGVKSYQSGQQADVAAGQSAAVDAKAGMTTAGVTGKPSITRTRVSVSPVAAAAEIATSSKASGKSQKSDSTSPQSANGATSSGSGASSKGGKGSAGGAGAGSGEAGKGGGGKGGKGGSAGGKDGNSGNGKGGSAGGKGAGSNGNGGGKGGGNGGGKGPGGAGGGKGGDGKGGKGDGKGSDSGKGNDGGKGGNDGDSGGKGSGGKGGNDGGKGGGKGEGGKGGGDGGGKGGHK